MYALSLMLRLSLSAFSEHSFGRKWGEILAEYVDTPVARGYNQRNTLFSDNDNFGKIAIEAGYDEDSARYLFSREPGMLRTG